MSFLEKYQSVLANMSPNAPVRIDLGSQDHAPIDTESPALSACASAPPSKVLWNPADYDVSCIGIRITEPIKAPGKLASKMAALAIERKIFPVFISWCEDSGLQHYGLHVEHISGSNPEACQEYEEQLKRLWNLAIIINADEIATAI